MKTKILSTLLSLLIGSVMLAPVSADSRWKGNDLQDRHYQERRGESKSVRRDKQQKPYTQSQKKNARSNTKTINSGKRKQDTKRYQPLEKQNNRQDRRSASQRQHSQEIIRDDRKIKREHNDRDYRKTRRIDRRHDSRDNRWKHRRYELRRGNRLLLLTPRHRTYRNVYIVRPFGHSYYGYGHFINDHNAWRWLAFTAITIKLLDMVDEQAQREHEAAQIDATTAEIGERIYWDTDDASGYVVTTREGVSSRGLTCREYQHSITVGGKTEDAYGTACLQPDGAWKIIN